MHWVLEETEEDERFAELVACLDARGIPHSEHYLIPVAGILIPDIDIPDGNAICIGSHSMRLPAAENGWSPGVFDILAIDFRIQLEHWGDRMLNHGSRIMRFRDVRLNAETFLRPIDDSKDFTGSLYMPEAFAEWQERLIMLGKDSGGTLTGDTLVQVSAPKEILQEARYWIVDGEIATSSIYSKGDIVESYPVSDEAMDAYCRECIAIWQPVESFVIDICETPDGYRIIEINTMNSCGFYACDFDRLVDALTIQNDRRHRQDEGMPLPGHPQAAR